MNIEAWSASEHKHRVFITGAAVCVCVCVCVELVCVRRVSQVFPEVVMIRNCKHTPEKRRKNTCGQAVGGKTPSD